MTLIQVLWHVEDERKVLIAIKKIEFGLVKWEEKSMLFLKKLGFQGQSGRAGIMPVPDFRRETERVFNRTADYWMFAEASSVGHSQEPRKKGSARSIQACRGGRF